MKKFELSIPQPCHENWEAMTPEDKGRFCGSCQKTVVDFSTMSDRQLAEFFKRPIGSVCGRFHNDQLEREIEIPRKRIPWVKYFFQFTWPAFVLFLKSCGQRETIVGEMVPIEKTVKKAEGEMSLTMGVILNDITPVDSLPNAQKPVVTKAAESDCHTVGEIALPPVMGDTIALLAVEPVIMGKVTLPVNSVAKPDVIITKPSCTRRKASRKIEAIQNDSAGFGKAPFAFQPSLFHVDERPKALDQLLMGRLGGVSVVHIFNKKKKTEPKVNTIEKKSINIPSFLVYPNPVAANSILSIKAASLPEGKYIVSLIDGAGAVVQQSFYNVTKENSSFPFVLKQLTAGTYFLQLINQETGVNYSEKIIVQ